jgi:hypothetical protein
MTEPSLAAVWEEFGKDPLFRDLDLLQDLRILRRAVRFVLECYPQFEGARRLRGIRNAFIAFGGHKRGMPAERGKDCDEAIP